MSNNKNIIPKGFQYLENEDVLNKYEILEQFIKNKGDFTKLVEFPPVAFSEHFRKSSNIIGNKAYEFKDKKERNLILTPDSQVHLFDYFLLKDLNQKSARYSWISPTFRYRHAPTRHFYQIGYSSVNYKTNGDVAELFLCLKTLKNLVQKIYSGKMELRITNSSLIFEMLTSKIKNNGEIQKILLKMRELKDIHRIKYINEILCIDLQQMVFRILNGDNIEAYNIGHHQQYKSTIDFLKLCSDEYDITYQLDLTSFHSSEILSGVGFILEVKGKQIGDGGIYSLYGNKYDNRIKKVVSICTGVNPLVRLLRSEYAKN
jgi:histidyl-tRNA synthetase